MTKVRIEPGICGFTAIAEAEAAEDFMVHLRVASGCAAVQEMMKALGSTFARLTCVSPSRGRGRFTPTPRSISPFTLPAPSSPGSPSAQKRNAILLSGRTPGYFLRNNAPKGRLRFSFYVEKQTPS